MTRSWVPVAGLGCVLLAAWLLSSPGRGSRQLHESAAPDARQRSADPVFADLGQSENRLRRGLSGAPQPASRRNLFTFQDVAPAVSPASRTPVLPPTAGPPPRPPMRLVGIAQDDKDGQRVRVALISVFDQLFFMKEGERLLARFVVARIGDDAVQLKDGEDSFTLALR